jgi:hypothetical protein
MKRAAISAAIIITAASVGVWAQAPSQPLSPSRAINSQATQQRSTEEQRGRATVSTASDKKAGATTPPSPVSLPQVVVQQTNDNPSNGSSNTYWPPIVIGLLSVGIAYLQLRVMGEQAKIAADQKTISDQQRELIEREAKATEE